MHSVFKILMHVLTHSVLFSVLCTLTLTLYCMATDPDQLSKADQDSMESQLPATVTTTTTEEEEEFVPATQHIPNSTIIPATPQFVVRLPDKNLLCFSFEGYELFSYNLITSGYLVLNGFLNVTSIQPHKQYNQTRGFNDIGVIVKAVDKRIKVGRRFFKHLIYGGKKKAVMEGFGEVDMSKGAITFSLMNGHSNIESQQSPHEKFRVILDKPKTEILAVASNGNTFNVYVEDCAGLVKVDIHGLIGQFFHPKVRVRENYNELHLADGRVVPVEKGVVWEALVDEGYQGQTCWYPREGESVIEGHPWEYVVEHIMSTHFKYSLFSYR